MSEMSRRAQFPALPDLGDLLDPFHLLWGGRPLPEAYGIRVETRLEDDGAYVVRAELPGVDPGKDVEVTVTDGVLAIHAVRSEQHETRHHSEFRYGTFTRSVRLPEGAKQDEVTATYKGGILAVRVLMEQTAKPASRTIKVETAE
jgi:HSP20 family molecular chaperone IbpA